MVWILRLPMCLVSPPPECDVPPVCTVLGFFLPGRLYHTECILQAAGGMADCCERQKLAVDRLRKQSLQGLK